MAKKITRTLAQRERTRKLRNLRRQRRAATEKTYEKSCRMATTAPKKPGPTAAQERLYEMLNTKLNRYVALKLSGMAAQIHSAIALKRIRDEETRRQSLGLGE